MKRGLVIAFPGTGYTCKEPLFSACIDAYRARGYDAVALDFSGIPFRQIATIEEALARAQAAVWEQLANTCFSSYTDIVFLSKSLGTSLAGWYAERRSLSPRQFYLTPTAQALPYVRDPRRVIGMVIGTEDAVLDYRIVTAFCKERGIPCLVAHGVGHSLKPEDVDAESVLNARIVALCAGNE